MTLEFSQFDTRHYAAVDAAAGYDEWAATYDDVVLDEMDLRLFAWVQYVDWAATPRAAELACGTGRVGQWLNARGVARIDGIDLSPKMLARAKERGVYEPLHVGDVRATPFDSNAYDLVIISLADEHLPDLHPLYAEASRLLRPGGAMALAGYHPQFLMAHGMPTHYHRAGGEPVAIETWVHLLSDHINAATSAGLTLREMHEGLVDDEYIAAKSKWAAYRNTPVSFAMGWRK